MPTESLLELAALAGQMVVVVAAAPADVWEAACGGFAKLLGCGNAEQTRLVERQLDDTRSQLASVITTYAGRIRVALAERWAGRWKDLLEEHPGAEDDLRLLIEGIWMSIQARTVPVSGRAGDDDNISMSGDDVTTVISP